MEVARQRGDDFQLVFTRYAIERFLYRLSESPYGGGFVLKGAMLFHLWANEPHRATRDLDLLGSGDSSVERMADIVRYVCSIPVLEDGLDFDPATVVADRIKEDQEYEGVRVTCWVRLGQARITLQIDVGFGDAVVSPLIRMDYPTILNFPHPILHVYPKESVVAEKFQAMVALGMANSRMKDFFDLWILARDFEFNGAILVKAFSATFLRRLSVLPTETPLALTEEFGRDPVKIKQWKGFMGKGKFTVNPGELTGVIAFLEAFLLPASQAAAKGEPFLAIWPAGGPWTNCGI